MKKSIKYLLGYYSLLLIVAFATSTFVSFDYNPLQWGEISKLLFLVILSIGIKSKHG